ncbi:hypothetical protein SUDANB121_03230 [Nocardiopsis dassonvillei]|uniref:YbaK/EbsC family protein n=1 Tax=Nocardiopsis dassonvillei TaxID=2014 RepID=UPI003F56D8EA
MSVTLNWVDAGEQEHLMAAPVRESVRGHAEVRVAPIDPNLADTAAFCSHYGMAMETSANCVVVAAKRGGETTYAACLVLATDRADVNGTVRRHLGARKASFASMAEATGLTGMEYGGITPFGLPQGWPILVDEAVAAAPHVVVGSGLRRSKLWVPGKLVAALPNAEVIALAQR